jgi:hypothetical protein
MYVCITLDHKAMLSEVDDVNAFKISVDGWSRKDIYGTINAYRTSYDRHPHLQKKITLKKSSNAM